MNTIINNGISENYKFIIFSDMSFLTFSRFLSLNSRDHSKKVQVFYDKDTINDMLDIYLPHLHKEVSNPDIVFYIFNKEKQQHICQHIDKLLQRYTGYIPIFLNADYADNIKQSILFSNKIPDDKERTILSSRYTHQSMPKITAKLGVDEFIDIRNPKRYIH